MMYFENCPFTVDRHYKVKQDIVFLNHVLQSGDIVVFAGHAYDAKAGITRFSFRHPETGESNSWHVSDNDDIKEEDWTHFFELVEDR